MMNEGDLALERSDLAADEILLARILGERAAD